MITIRVCVVLPSNETRDLELPLNTDIDHLYARLVTRAGLPTTTERGEPIPYGFYHRRGERYLPAHVSLVDAGVANGDIIDVVPYPTVRPPIRALEEAHLYRQHRFVPAPWLVRYMLAIAAIIALVVVLAARQAGQPVTDFVDANPLSTSIEPGALTQATTFMRDDGDAGLIVQPGSFTARATLSERKVSNPSPGVAGFQEVIGPVFDFVMVSEGAIAEPLVVKLRAPGQAGAVRLDAAALTVVHWEADAARWALLPTRYETDGYLYAPTMTLGIFGVAQAGEVLLWQENGTLEIGSYWELFGGGDRGPHAVLADASGRWLTADELTTLTGLMKLNPDGVASIKLANLPVEGETFAVSLAPLLDEKFVTDGPYLTPVPDADRPVASGSDVQTTEWKSVQVQAPAAYRDGPKWTVIPVRARLVRRAERIYLEYAADARDLRNMAPVDFVWLAHNGDGAWASARLSADQLRSGLVELPAAPTRVSLVTLGQPYEAWAVWGPGQGQRLFSIGAISWAGEANINTPTAQSPLDPPLAALVVTVAARLRLPA